MRGRMTEKVDVFAFGVVLLEILAGRPNYDDALEEDKIYIFEWVSSVAHDELLTHGPWKNNIIWSSCLFSTIDLCY